MSDNLMPHLAAPVERVLTGTPAGTENGLTPSIWGGITWKNVPFAGVEQSRWGMEEVPFAGEGDE